MYCCHPLLKENLNQELLGYHSGDTTIAELEIVPCNYIMPAKSDKITVMESNLYGIEFC